jgi:hypothetical protein
MVQLITTINMFLNFSIKKGFYIKLVSKVVTIWLPLRDAPILLMYIKMFQIYN